MRRPGFDVDIEHILLLIGLLLAIAVFIMFFDQLVQSGLELMRGQS